MIKDRRVLIGITGSIAAFKSLDIIRSLLKEGAIIDVVMTDSATLFVSPLTISSFTTRHVFTGLFDDPFTHINLARQTELLLIAPATANTISKLACGIADNLLTNIVLAYNGIKLIAPAMNHRMYENPVIRENIRRLEERGFGFIGPVEGQLACGDEGMGRMAEVDDIVETVITALSPKDLKGQKVLVTAGPTREYIDAVRFISNRSSGRMGYEIARASVRRGADVILISGPSSLTPPPGVKLINVESASQMEDAVFKNLKGVTVVVMASAVCDLMPESRTHKKLDKDSINILKLKKTNDILKRLSMHKGKRVVVGFSAEYGQRIDRAKEKLKDKGLDLIVFNDISKKGAGFDVETNIVSIIHKDGSVEDLPLMKKTDVADIILDRIRAML
ncbi:MAG: bifunctional phosphopantothenoylcysteine decarboxylase/phosphopantothenate--cysteine ligase CoaBC [Thermodesulfovibrionia bacterium]